MNRLIYRSGLMLWFIVFFSVFFFSRAAQLNSYFSLWMGILWGCVGLIWLSGLWQEGTQIQNTPLDWGLLAVVCALVISAVFSLDPSRSWRMVSIWLACLLTFYMAVAFFRTKQLTHEATIGLYLIVLFLMAILAYFTLVQWGLDWYAVFGTELGIPRPPRVNSRVSPNILAIWLNFGLLLGWGVWQSYKRPWWGWLLFLFFFPLLLFTGSRSGFLGFFVGSVVIVGGNWWRQGQKHITFKTGTHLAGLMVGVGLAMGLVLFVLRPETFRMNSNFSILYRGEFWSVAWDMWLSRPWVGQGIDTFGTFFMLNNLTAPPATPFRAAHSWWMSLLGEAGLFGIGAALACWVLLGWWLWRHRASHYWTPTAVGTLAALAAFTVHTTFDTPEHLVFFFAAIWMAILITVLNPTPERHTQTRPWRTSWTILLWTAILFAGIWVYPATQKYEQGVAAVKVQDWAAAANHFAAAQAHTFYTDTSIALAEALTLGRLSMENPTYLPAAITTYEQVITHEPGWPSNYANLAALYWQFGETQTAITLLEQAHAISTNVSIYPLQLGLWYESLDESRVATDHYQQVAILPNVWASAPFWQTTPIRQSRAPAVELDSAWLALIQQDWESANRLYRERLQVNQRDGEAYMGLGIEQLFIGNNDEATRLLNRAKLLGQNNADLWLAAQADPTLAFLDTYRYHSTFGLGQEETHIYPILLLNRRALPYDLLPQLHCLSLDESTSQHLRLLNMWSAVDSPLPKILFASATKGIVPCTPLD